MLLSRLALQISCLSPFYLSQLGRRRLCDGSQTHQLVSTHAPHTSCFSRRRSDAWPRDDIASLPPHLRPQPAETLDLILRQKIYLIQARRGYRANVDSHVLAHFASSRYALQPFSKPSCTNAILTSQNPRPRILDLGAGTGLVSILFARAHTPHTLTLVELQPQLVHRIHRNLALNTLSGTVLNHDLHNGTLPLALHSAVDVVLVNPPFYPANSRKPPSHRERQLAHIESSATLQHFLSAARVACDPANSSAFVALIYDIIESSRIPDALRYAHLVLLHYQHVCHTPSHSPTRILYYLVPCRPEYQHLCLTCNTANLDPTSSLLKLSKLILHPDPTQSTIFSDEMEHFLHNLPQPSLRIGRLCPSNDS